jgi:hypothetical protein
MTAPILPLQAAHRRRTPLISCLARSNHVLHDTERSLKETRLTDAALTRGHSSQVPCIRCPMLPPSLIQLIHNIFHPTNPNTCTKANLATHKFDHKKTQCLHSARAWRTPAKQAQLVTCTQRISMLSVRGFYSGYWRSPSSHSTHLRRAHTAPF